MAKKKPAKGNVGPGGQAAGPTLPPGVKLLRTLEGHRGAVTSVAFDPQGGTLASGSADSIVNQWDARSGQHLRTFSGRKHVVLSLAFDTPAETLATGGDDKTVKLWDVRSCKLLHTLQGHRDAVSCLSFTHKFTDISMDYIHFWHDICAVIESRNDLPQLHDGAKLCAKELLRNWMRLTSETND